MSYLDKLRRNMTVAPTGNELEMMIGPVDFYLQGVSNDDATIYYLSKTNTTNEADRVTREELLELFEAGKTVRIRIPEEKCILTCVGVSDNDTYAVTAIPHGNGANTFTNVYTVEYTGTDTTV